MKEENLIDENFAGSIFEVLGFEARLCRHCKAHLREGICLNACNLSGYQYRCLLNGVKDETQPPSDSK